MNRTHKKRTAYRNNYVRRRHCQRSAARRVIPGQRCLDGRGHIAARKHITYNLSVWSGMFAYEEWCSASTSFYRLKQNANIANGSSNWNCVRHRFYFGINELQFLYRPNLCVCVLAAKYFFRCGGGSVRRGLYSGWNLWPPKTRQTSTNRTTTEG